MACYVVRTPSGNVLRIRARRRPSPLDVLQLEADLARAWRLLAGCLCGVEHPAW